MGVWSISLFTRLLGMVLSYHCSTPRIVPSMLLQYQPGFSDTGIDPSSAGISAAM